MLSFAEGSRRSSLTEEQKRRTSPAWLVERREAKFNMYVAGFVNAYCLGSRSSLTEEQKRRTSPAWLVVCTSEKRREAKCTTSLVVL